jgi:hypothetical protein
MCVLQGGGWTAMLIDIPRGHVSGCLLTITPVSQAAEQATTFRLLACLAMGCHVAVVPHSAMNLANFAAMPCHMELC